MKTPQDESYGSTRALIRESGPSRSGGADDSFGRVDDRLHASGHEIPMGAHGPHGHDVGQAPLGQHAHEATILDVALHGEGRRRRHTHPFV
jgi:hypothetical protein